MKGSGSRTIARGLDTLFSIGAIGGLSDGQLLDRFVERREAAAFEAIVHRHGPMVWGVCRRILRDSHDAEDAFQATFLVLARRAASVHPREKLCNWLHGLAYQTARKARAMREKRRTRESQGSDYPEPTVVDRDSKDELIEVLDRELSRLPEKYRSPVVLCELEGKTQIEAANQLGWPVGTVASRLSRARTLLASRLSRRGLTLSASSVTVLLAQGSASANVPARLFVSTTQLACLIETSGVASGVVSAKVAALTSEVMKIMLLGRLKGLTTVALGCLVLGAGGTGLAYRSLDSMHQGPAKQQPAPENAERKPLRLAQAATKRDEPPPLDEATRKKMDELIAQLRTTDMLDQQRWAAIRDLAAIGKPAVPRLIEELDRTTEDRALRSLGFTLRTIGDPRAVPALIRAIPRTMINSGSDFGLTVDDEGLFKFLQQHDLDPKMDGQHFSFGRPFREITGALKTLAGHKFNEDELNFVGPFGGTEQIRLQTRYFHQFAKQWASWWDTNSGKFTSDAAYAKTDLHLPPLPNLPDRNVDPAQPFPLGDKVRSASGFGNAILGPRQPLAHYRTFIDLDTRRMLGWPEKSVLDPEKAKDSDVSSWANREGYDLRGVEYLPPGAKTPTFAIQGLGLRAWRVDDATYDTLEQDLREGKAPDLSQPVKDLLMDQDAQSGAYHPENKATFLFVTREGATGVLQVTGIVNKLLDKNDIGKPAGDGERKGHYRGVQYQYKLVYEQIDP